MISVLTQVQMQNRFHFSKQTHSIIYDLTACCENSSVVSDAPVIQKEVIKMIFPLLKTLDISHVSFNAPFSASRVIHRLPCQHCQLSTDQIDSMKTVNSEVCGLSRGSRKAFLERHFPVMFCKCSIWCQVLVSPNSGKHNR